MPQTGIEPVLDFNSNRIFKSCASASSATAAYTYLNYLAYKWDQ